MKHLLRLRWHVVAAVILSPCLKAAPVDFTTGLITGAHVNTRSSGGVQSQGIEIEYPVWDWILDKDYTHRVVEYNGNERDESYVGLGPTRDYGFASGTATALGDIEVGTANPIRTMGGMIGVSGTTSESRTTLTSPLPISSSFISIADFWRSTA